MYAHVLSFPILLKSLQFARSWDDVAGGRQSSRGGPPDARYTLAKSKVKVYHYIHYSHIEYAHVTQRLPKLTGVFLVKTFRKSKEMII